MPAICTARRLISPAVRVLALLAVFLVGAIGANLAAPKSVKGEVPAEYTVTRPLYGGWNFLSWVGDDVDVSDLKRSIPEIAEVLRTPSRWPDANVVPLTDADRLRSGDILWVRVNLPFGESADWAIAADLAERDVPLRRGLNVIGWPGRDMVRGEDLIETAVGTPQALTIWDGARQSWQLVTPQDMSPLDQGTRIRTGDAFLMWTAQPATWSRPTGSPRRWFSATASLATAETMLASTFGLYPPALEILVVSSWSELAVLSGDDQYADIREGGCPAGPFSYVLVHRESAHTLLEPVLEAGPKHILVNRSCTPVAEVGARSLGVLFASIGARSPHGEIWGVTAWGGFTLSPSSDARHEAYIEESRAVSCTLRQQDQAACDIRPIWYLYTKYLIDRFGASLLAEFIASPTKAPDAYYEVFGVEIDTLLDEFEHHRAVVAPPVGATGDRILVSGPEALLEESRIREIVVDVEQFFSDEFGFPAGSLTWRVTSITGTGRHDCGLGSYTAVFVGPQCFLAPSVYAHEYFHHLQREWSTLIRAAGPEWELEGQAHYWDTLFSAKDDETIYERVRAGWVANAAMASAPALNDPALANLDHGPEYWLGALAAEMLASIAGRHAIRDWYAAMVAAYHDTQDYEIAEQRGFQETYGMTLDEFYKQFAAWRADGFPPLDEGGTTP